MHKFFPLYLGNPERGTLVSSEDPNEMQHNAAFHQGLHTLFVMVNKFSFLKEGLPSLKTACAPCMLGTPPNLVIFYTTLKPRHTQTSTIVIESVGKILFWQKKTQTVI